MIWSLFCDRIGCTTKPLVANERSERACIARLVELVKANDWDVDDPNAPHDCVTHFCGDHRRS